VFVGYVAGATGVPGTNSSSRNVAVGSGAFISPSTANDNVILGYNNGSTGITTGDQNVAIGNRMEFGIGTGTGNVRIGYASASLGTGNLSNTIVIGGNSPFATASNQMVIGSTAGKINDAYIGAGITSTTASATPLTINSSTGSGANIAGQTMTLRPGAGTGTANGGDLNASVALPTTSSSTANSYTNVLNISGATGLTGLSRSLALNPIGTSTGNTGELRFLELAAGGTNYTGFKSPDALAGNVIYTLPIADGSANNVLSTNGSGVLSWASAPTGSGATNKLAYWSSSTVIDDAPDFTMDVGNGYLMTNGAFTGISGTGADAVGGALNVQGGQSTGNAAGGELRLATSQAGAPGSTPNPMSTRLSIDSMGVTKIGDIPATGNGVLMTINDFGNLVDLDGLNATMRFGDIAQAGGTALLTVDNSLGGSAGVISLATNGQKVAETTPDGTFSLPLGFRLNNARTSSDSTLLETDAIIIVTPSGTPGSPITITLPTAPVQNQYYVIKDGTGNSVTNNITIDGNGNNIDGAGTHVINTAFASVTLTYNATLSLWSII